MDKNKKPLHREFSVGKRAEDLSSMAREDGESVIIKGVSISSTEPVERMIWDAEENEYRIMNEVLDHGPEAIDLSGVSGGKISVTTNHWGGDPVGVVENPRISGEKLYIDERYSRADPYASRMMAGIARNRSVGYVVKEYKIDKSLSPPEARAVRWELKHVAIVTDPADSVVGVGREKNYQPKQRSSKMDPEENKTNNQSPAITQEALISAKALSKSEGAKKAFERHANFDKVRNDFFELHGKKFDDATRSALAKEVQTISERMATDENYHDERFDFLKAGSDILGKAETETISHEEAISRNINQDGADPNLTARNGVSFDEICRREWIGKGRNKDGSLGRGRLNLGDLISRSAHGKSPNQFHQSIDSVLREYEQELANKNCGRHVGAFPSSEGAVVVPADLWARAVIDAVRYNNLQVPGMRALAATIPSGGSKTGGDAIATEIAMDMLQAHLYSTAPLLELGAMLIQNQSSNLSIPTTTEFDGASFVLEAGAISAEDIVFSVHTFNPHRLGARMQLQRQAIIQINMGLQGFITSELFKGMRVKEYGAILAGAASGNDPTGILNFTGVLAGDVTAAAGNGGNMDFGDAVDAESALNAENFSEGNRAWLMTPGAMGKLKQTAKVASSDSKMVIEDDRMLNGYPVHWTNLLPSNLTKGTGTGLHAVIFGIWSELLIVEFGDMTVIVDEYTNSDKGQINITLEKYMDAAPKRPKAFRVSKDVSVA